MSKASPVRQAGPDKVTPHYLVQMHDVQTNLSYPFDEFFLSFFSFSISGIGITTEKALPGCR